MAPVAAFLLVIFAGTCHATDCVGSSCRRGDKTISMLQRSVKSAMVSIDSTEEEDGDERQQHRQVHQHQHQHQNQHQRRQEHNVKHGTSLSSGAKVIAGRVVYNFDKRFVQAGKGRLGENLTDWLVFFDEGVSDGVIHGLCQKIQTETGHPCLHEGHPTEHGIPYLDFQGTDEELERVLSFAPGVMFAEPEAEVQADPEVSDTPATSVWSLDRVDDRSGYDASYVPGHGLSGKDISVYVLDTGVFTQHEEFEGRAIPTLDLTSGQTEVCAGETSCAADVNGHGTHCAGTVAGKTYGIAKSATIRAVKVLGDSGGGSLSWIATAMDWIATNGIPNSVLSMSLGMSGVRHSFGTTIDTMTQSGFTVVVAAGNSDSDACNFSPAFVQSAITVGSTTKQDQRSWFSNYGECLDLYAPGSSISSVGTEAGSTTTKSGTSMACPQVAGAAALALEMNPTLNGNGVAELLLQWSTKEVVKDAMEGSPNRLLYVGTEIPAVGPVPPPTPRPTPNPTPVPTPPPGPATGYIDLGPGACTGMGDYIPADNAGVCSTHCDSKGDQCDGYAFSDLYKYCYWVHGENIQGGAFDFGGANCMKKSD